MQDACHCYPRYVLPIVQRLERVDKFNIDNLKPENPKEIIKPLSRGLIVVGKLEELTAFIEK